MYFIPSLLVFVSYRTFSIVLQHPQTHNHFAETILNLHGLATGRNAQPSASLSFSLPPEGTTTQRVLMNSLFAPWVFHLFLSLTSQETTILCCQ
jgi:hypothetical protein